MKTILKISLLILSISLVNCKKTNQFYVVELENEPAIVRKITDPPDYEKDELYYLELVNPHPKLDYTALYVADMFEGYNSAELFEPYETEGLAVKISGIIGEAKKPAFPKNFHFISLNSIEIDE